MKRAAGAIVFSPDWFSENQMWSLEDDHDDVTLRRLLSNGLK